MLPVGSVQQVWAPYQKTSSRKVIDLPSHLPPILAQQLIAYSNWWRPSEGARVIPTSNAGEKVLGYLYDEEPAWFPWHRAPGNLLSPRTHSPPLSDPSPSCGGGHPGERSHVTGVRDDGLEARASRLKGQ
jgi:hypothetical protein